MRYNRELNCISFVIIRQEEDEVESEEDDHEEVEGEENEEDESLEEEDEGKCMIRIYQSDSQNSNVILPKII